MAGRTFQSAKRWFAAATLLAVSLAVLPALHGERSGGAPSSNSPLYTYGPVELRPHFTYSGSYNDGLLNRNGRPLNSYIDAYSAGLLVRLGDRWSIDYTPTYAVYSNPLFRDILNQSVNAAGGVAFGNTALQFKQAYAYSSNPLTETGRQTDMEVVTTELTAGHAVGRALGLETGFAQKLNFISASPDFHEWTIFGAIHSNVTKAITGRVGVYSGYAAVFKSADMTYVQPRAEISWNSKEKVTLTGGVSVDYRVFLARRWRWTENLLFTGSARYSPFATTLVEGKVDRTITPSMFDGQTADATRWSVAGEQRFLGRFWLSGGLDYDDVKYLTTGRSTGFRRKDNIWTYRAAVRTTFLSRGGISVSYQDSDNSSNLDGYGVKSSRIACDVSWRY